jgi:hypothetical protein
MTTPRDNLAFDLTKSDGETQPFDPEKLRASFERTGAGEGGSLPVEAGDLRLGPVGVPV